MADAEPLAAGAATENADAAPADVVDITGDGGVLKEILKPGAGAERPEKGDKVEVHYVGRLQSDGSEFDSSRGRGQPFSFALATGAVIKGWDAAVATMARGELARVTLREDYAYGAAGSPPKIPGRATLVFDIELLGWASDRDLTGDGGLLRTVLTPGEGWASPKAEDEARVALVARAVDPATGQPAAAPFHESPAGGELFEVRRGLLCPAVGLAVQRMKRGEAVRLAVAPQYGFGSEGLPPGVPPDAPLQLDLTLLGWNTVSKVTPDGGVIKKTLAETEGWQRPNAGATVTVAFTARGADGAVLDSRGAEDPLVFVTEEGQAPCEGFELGVMQMKKGERAELAVSAAYAGGAPVTYDLELLDFEKAKDSWEMDPAEKVAAAAALKDKGNAAFKAGDAERATKFWERALRAVEHDDAFPADAKAAKKELTRAANLNLAAAALKAGRPLEARTAADRVLAIDPGNPKALFRRASAWLATQDWVECGRDVASGLAADPESADFKALGRRLKAAEAAASKKEAALWAGSFARMARAEGGK